VVPAVVEHRRYSDHPFRVTPTQEASAVFRRKQIYEELHLETKHGANQHTRGVDNLATPSERFTAATSETTGKIESASVHSIAAPENSLVRVLQHFGGNERALGSWLVGPKHHDGHAYIRSRPIDWRREARGFRVHIRRVADCRAVGIPARR
jgi:hypothetical protein